MDNVLNMVVYRRGHVLCSLKPQGQGLEADAPPLVHLDRRLDRPYQQFTPSTGRVEASYNSGSNVTTFTLPFTPVEEVLAIMKYETATTRVCSWVRPATDLGLHGERRLDNAQVAFGERYEFRYEGSAGRIC